MRIAVGSDHAGFPLKQVVVPHLAAAGHTVLDLGTDGAERCDYPDFGAAVARAVAPNGTADLGVCICGSGIGISMAANKIAGIRAALVYDTVTARLAREHNDANVVCLGARTTDQRVALDALDAFLGASFEGGRHLERIGKIQELERTT